MIIVPESASALKGFIAKASLHGLAQAIVLRMSLAFIMHRGRMSCSQAAGCLASETFHRGQITRFLRRPRWQRDDFNAPLRVALLQMESCTGRFTAADSDNDVLQFNVAFVINIKSIMPFLKELCSVKEHKFRGLAGDQPEQTFKHNQRTVLETKFRSVEDYPYSLYDFGDDPVVELDLICEYILNPYGYDEIKPATVKAAIVAAPEAK